ncbi:MAG: hypothetical protein LBO20_03280, partial [Bifidobacteriaceae bacterium]|nr:hypothetical protein [Bifidobacteriaceae bacterium]
MSAWLAAYARDDDAALAALANPGLVRRAGVLATEAEWVEDPSGPGATVRVGRFEVRLDGRGAGHARCPCPSAGVCVHVVTAAKLARQRAGGLSGASAAPADGVADAGDVVAGGVGSGDADSGGVVAGGAVGGRTASATGTDRSNPRQRE